ncbi:MAG: hypothetical protein JSS96_03815 [Bacteroidetes bacterium]|nr:hypothetical protein [Bacteroidota bacterium]
MKVSAFCLFLFISFQGYSQSDEVAIQVVAPEQFFVNSATNLTGNSRHITQIKLPPNTVKWYYSFSAYRNPIDIQRTAAEFNLFAQLSRLIDETGTTANAISLLSKPPGSNYCDVFLLNSPYDVENFEKKREPCHYYREGSVTSLESGLIEVTDVSRLYGVQYLGFRNQSMTNGININLQVVAIIRKEKTANGWTKEIKNDLFNKFKQEMIKDEVSKYLSNDEIESFAACLLKKMTSTYTPKSLQALADFEIKELLKGYSKECENDLQINLKERKAQSNNRRELGG